MRKKIGLHKALKGISVIDIILGVISAIIGIIFISTVNQGLYETYIKTLQEENSVTTEEIIKLVNVIGAGVIVIGVLLMLSGILGLVKKYALGMTISTFNFAIWILAFIGSASLSLHTLFIFLIVLLQAAYIYFAAETRDEKILSER